MERAGCRDLKTRTAQKSTSIRSPQHLVAVNVDIKGGKFLLRVNREEGTMTGVAGETR